MENFFSQTLWSINRTTQKVQCYVYQTMAVLFGLYVLLFAPDSKALIIYIPVNLCAISLWFLRARGPLTLVERIQNFKNLNIRTLGEGQVKPNYTSITAALYALSIIHNMKADDPEVNPSSEGIAFVYEKDKVKGTLEFFNSGKNIAIINIEDKIEVWDVKLTEEDIEKALMKIFYVINPPSDSIINRGDD